MAQNTKAQQKALSKLCNADKETVESVVANLNPRTRNALVAKGQLTFDTRRTSSLGNWNGTRYTCSGGVVYRNIKVTR